MSRPKVFIILINWNGKKDTLECLESLSKISYPNFKVVVVDNGSSDGSVQAIQERFPDVDLLKAKKNLGFTGGNNLAMRHAVGKNAEFVFLLNNDTVVDSEIIDELLGASRLFNHEGIFGPKIYYYSDPNKIWFAGTNWNPQRFEFVNIAHQQQDNNKNSNKIKETDFVNGCALFLSTEILKKVGLFDERFFLTYEETDLCYRARAFGYKSILVPRAKVWHKVSVSFGGELSPLFIYFMTRNRLLWAEIHLSLKERIRLYAKTLNDFVRCFFPPKPNGCNLELTLSGIRNYLKIYRHDVIKKYTNPVKRATVWAITDYVLRNFGNCPEAVRSIR
jgi:GT2 family glycosyltransferase